MKNILLILAVSILLTGCQQSEVANTKVNSDNKTVQAIASSELKFEHTMSEERAQIGVPYKIMLDFSGVAESVLSTEFSTSNGLNMVSEATASIQMNDSGKAGTRTITVIPQSEGIHYVNIYQSGAKQKPSVIRVIAGDKDIEDYLETNGVVREQEDGSKVISMKADEG